MAFYITPKDSETGKKIQAILSRCDLAETQIEKLKTKYGFRDSYVFQYKVAGIDSVYFNQNPDPRLWSKSKDGLYRPKRTTPEGREIKKEFDSVETVYNDELNQCVCTLKEENPFRGSIGLAWNHQEFIGFEINLKWKPVMNKDCKEITESKYHKMFK